MEHGEPLPRGHVELDEEALQRACHMSSIARHLCDGMPHRRQYRPLRLSRSHCALRPVLSRTMGPSQRPSHPRLQRVPGLRPPSPPIPPQRQQFRGHSCPIRGFAALARAWALSAFYQLMSTSAYHGCSPNSPLRGSDTGRLHALARSACSVSRLLLTRLCRCQALIIAPRLTPQPILVKCPDRNGILHGVGQVLVQIGERVGVSRERVVLATQPVLAVRQRSILSLEMTCVRR